MTENLPVQLASIVVLGVGAQWLAWRLKLPAILLLLLAGFLAGPALEWAGYRRLVDPDRLLGDLLLPVVSLSVAVILFEGGLSLNLAELVHSGGVIRNLVTLGAAVTWGVATVAARVVLGLTWPLATLLGAILVVTGPTVIGPLLRHVKPTGRTGPILRWEGIVIDPIGAMLAVLVFEAIPQPKLPSVLAVLLAGSLKTVLIGGGIGLAGALAVVLFLRRYWIPDFLQNPVTLMTVVAAFTASNALRPESGLFAVTAMGIILANQGHVTVKPIAEFKESLTILLVSALFIVLASRLTIGQIASVGPRSVLFTLVLMLVARPAAVAVSTIGSGLSWGERAFLAAMAPRGIVAASVAAVFALRLRASGVEGADRLVPATFAVIVGTVGVYGLAATRVARRLGLSPSHPGFLIAGANPVARAIGEALRAEGLPLLLVDTRAE
ncbi:MAG TPA: cation:proton antiporter, partial [Isosphaeraceae bacterium]